MKVKRESEVTQSCLTLSDLMDCRLPGSSVHGIFQARVLEWGAIAFSSSGTVSIKLPGHVLGSIICTYSFAFVVFESIQFLFSGSFSVIQFSSVALSCRTLCVVSDSLRLHVLQHARPPCPSPISGVHPNPCPLSWWCHPTISSSVVPFSSCPQSFPASGWPKYWSFRFNISPSNEHPGLISLNMFISPATTMCQKPWQMFRI